MSLSSRLALPVILGGFIALFVSGVFTPDAAATSHDIGEIALLSSISGAGPLVLRQQPTDNADQVGLMQSRSWVWIDHCVTAEAEIDWCLVERGVTKGWVEAALLDVQWN